ncbi:MAG TPA: YiiG family protein [Polyangiaceae bacterium]|nr:YiiG family protein [Polyangiaceae bacterium]
MNRTIPIIILSLVLAAGCKRGNNHSGQAGPSAAAAVSLSSAANNASPPSDTGRSAQKAKEKDPDEVLSDKLKPYTDCINRISRSEDRAKDRYYLWVDPKKGPTGHESNIMGLIGLTDPANCVAGLDAAKTKQPSLPDVEAAGTAYGAAASTLYPLTNEADDYYTHKNYKDDKMAKGKEIHPKLAAAFDAFDKANADLKAQVGPLNRQAKERILAKLEKTEGRKIPYLRGESMLLAEDLMKLGDVKEPKALDLPKFTAKLGEFEKVLHELSTYLEAHRHEDSRTGLAGSIVKAGDEYLSAAKALMRRVRDKVPYDDSARASLRDHEYDMVDGSPQQLLYRYNDLIDATTF